MITAEGLKRVNENMKTVPIKGKDYVQVTERVKAFRELCPEGSITTEIVYFQDGEIVTKTTIADEDGRVLGTGFAHEKEGSSYINSTSYVENCETSSVGRAMSWLNIGIDASIASADEVANAMINQEKAKNATKAELKKFGDICAAMEQEPRAILKRTGWEESKPVTEEQLTKAHIILQEISNGA